MPGAGLFLIDALNAPQRLGQGVVGPALGRRGIAAQGFGRKLRWRGRALTLAIRIGAGLHAGIGQDLAAI